MALMRNIEKDDAREVLKLLKNGSISVRRREGIVQEFEDRFSHYLPIQYALSQNSGTSTLHAAYFALDLKEGDEVLAPAYTWHSSVTPLLNLKAKPIFCEINPKTLTIDPKDIKKRVTSRTKAISLTHLFGMPAEMDEILSIAKAHGLAIIEDCSHAFGTRYKGRNVGTIGDLSCFSMQGSKVLKAGEGGVFCTNDRTYYERALILGHPGRLDEVTNPALTRYRYSGLGYKYRPNPLSLAIAKSQLARLDRINAIIIESVTAFEHEMRSCSEISFFDLPSYSDYRSYYGYRMLCSEKVSKKRDEIVAALQAQGLSVDKEHMKLLHMLPVFTDNDLLDCHIKKTHLPITERIHERILAVTIPYGDNDAIRSIARSIKTAIQRIGLT